MDGCVQIVMDSMFGQWGTVLSVKNDKFLHCWVRLIGDIFLSTQKNIPPSMWYYFQVLTWKVLLRQPPGTKPS
jgi:hypothetical protein